MIHVSKAKYVQTKLDNLALESLVSDYEFQVALVEYLMRLFPRKQRQHFASKFITDEEACEGFMRIKDKDFETVSF